MSGIERATVLPEPSYARTTRSAPGRHRPRQGGKSRTELAARSVPDRDSLDRDAPSTVRSGRGAVPASVRDLALSLSIGPGPPRSRTKGRRHQRKKDQPHSKAGGTGPIISSRNALARGDDPQIPRDAALRSVAFGAVDHRGRQLRYGGVRLVVSNRGMFRTSFFLLLAAVGSEGGQPEDMSDDMRAIMSG